MLINMLNIVNKDRFCPRTTAVLHQRFNLTEIKSCIQPSASRTSSRTSSRLPNIKKIDPPSLERIDPNYDTYNLIKCVFLNLFYNFTIHHHNIAIGNIFIIKIMQPTIFKNILSLVTIF